MSSITAFQQTTFNPFQSNGATFGQVRKPVQFGCGDHIAFSATDQLPSPESQSAMQRFGKFAIKWGYQKNPLFQLMHKTYEKIFGITMCGYPKINGEFPSCSNYTMQAIEQYGFLKGGWKGFLRILSCNPISIRSESVVNKLGRVI